MEGFAAHHRARPLHRRRGAAADGAAGLRAALAGGARAYQAHRCERRREAHAGRAVRRNGRGCPRRRSRRRALYGATLKSRDGKPRHDTRRGRCWRSARCAMSASPWRWLSPRLWPAARDAAEAIEVDYEATLPAVTDAKDAIGAGAPQLFDHIPGNIVFDWDNDTGDAPRRRTPRSPRPRTSSRLISSTTESLSIRWSRATPTPNITRPTAARRFSPRPKVRISCAIPLAELVLKLPKDKLRLISPNVGGGFGMKAFVYPEHALVVWASRKISAASENGRRTARKVSSPTIRAATTSRAPSWRSTAKAASWLYAFRSSPISAHICRRSAASCRRALTDLVSGLYAIRGDSHQRQGCVQQHRAGLCLSRRRPAEAAYLLERLVDAAAREDLA